MAGEDESSYAGRWIARLRGRVVAQAGTPEQARRAAQSRFKETPEVMYIPTPSPLVLPNILDSVRSVLPAGLTVYLVGGAVRETDLVVSRHESPPPPFIGSRTALRRARPGSGRSAP